MKRWLIAIAVLSMITGILPVAAQGGLAVEIFVSPNGKDGAAGTMESPLATLEGAKNAVKIARAKSDEDTQIIVNFRGGVYPMMKTVAFDESDSGTQTGKVIYQAYGDEKVSFTGSVPIQASKFQPVTDEKILKRLPAEAKNKVGQLDLKAQGINSIPQYIPPTGFMDTPPSYTTLFVNGIEQIMSRWPNTGYAKIDTVIDQGAIKRNGDSSNKPAIIGYKGSYQDRWVTAKDLLIEGFFLNEYACERIYIAKVDPSAKTITTKSSTVYGVAENKRWSVFNLLEEIDTPGEYYIDRETMMLYFYPPYTLSDAKMELSVMRDDMITMKKVSNVEFKGITFERTCGNVMVTDSCVNILVANCTLKNIGREGIRIVKGKDFIVQSCNMLYIGGVCVYLDGGDRQTLTPGNNQVLNSYFYAMGRHTKTYAGAVDIFGVGNKVENNIMHEAPHLAIRFSGNDHSIKYNEIYNVVKESLDAGAIYSGRNYTMRGTEIAYNYIHDIATSVKNQGGIHAVAIYLDDQYCGTNVHHNVISNANLGFLIGGGHDNYIDSNILINCTSSINADNRAEGWSKSGAMPGGDPYISLAQVPYNLPPYDKYPGLANILDMFPGIPRGNSISGNLIYKSGKVNAADSFIKNAKKFENNIEVKDDPGFTDMLAQDYSLKPDSQILRQLPDLKDYPTAKIGMITDDYRKSVDRPSLAFKQISPKNGQGDINNLSYLFNWDNADGADKYKITIAKDTEMKEVVMQEESVYNYFNVSGMESGLKSFYWKVEAINYSKQISANKSAKGDPYLFTTPLYDKLDKSELVIALSDAVKMMDSIVEGDNAGEYKAGTKESMAKVIAEAKEINERKSGTQADINKMVTKLYDTSTQLGKGAKKGYINADYMLSSKDDWETTGNLNIDNGILTFGNANSDVAAFTAKPLKGFEMLCFKLKADLNGKWVAFALKQNKNGIMWSVGATGYLIVIKPDIIELQRFKGGSSEFLTTVPNTFVQNETWHNVQLGAIDSGMGITLTMKVDNKTVFNFMDIKAPIKQDGYFVIYDMTSGKYMSIAAADSLPQGDIEEEMTKSYPQPVTVDAKTLMDASLWSAVNGTITASGNGLALKGNNIGFKNKIPANGILKFKAKFNPGTKWQAIGLRMNRVDTPWNAGVNDYLVAIKPASIELQRFNNGKNEFIGIADNNVIKNGEWCDVEAGSYEVEGGVRLIFKVNNETLFDYVDPTPVAEAGNLAFFDFNGEGIEIAQ